MQSVFSLVSMVFLLVLGGCVLDRSGTRVPEPMEWDVVPQYFCPGDPVTVSWDFSRIGRSPEHCRPRHGGYDSLMSCASDRDCPTDGMGPVCLDGYCCRREIFEENHLKCEKPVGCYATFDLTITADTLTLEPAVDSESHALRGSRTVSPAATTTFTASGGVVDPAALFEESKTATLVTPTPGTNIPLEFPFTCTGSGPGWPPVDLDAITTAEHVRIIGVRNTSAHTIQLTGGEVERGPITMRPGEIVTVFNGGVGGVWSARLSPLDSASLRVPRCLPTDIEDPWPDLQVEVMLECAAE